MHTAEGIRDYVQEQLAIALEAKTKKYGDEPWRTGIPGAILEGRITALEDVLVWIKAD